MPDLSVVPPKPKLSRRDRLFIEHYLAAGDLESVAKVTARSHQGIGFPTFSLEDCTAMWERPDIREECEARIEMEATENARQLAKAKRLAPEFLSAHIVENIENAEPGSHKTKALELGCIVTGLIAKGELTPPKTQAENTPTIYRALQTTTVRRVTEEITQTQGLPAEPPVIEVKSLKPTDDSDVVDY